MHTILFLILLGLSHTTSADIKMPEPPTPPTLPTVAGVASSFPISPEKQDELTTAIIRLDSLNTLVKDLKSRLRELEEDRSKVQSQLLPASNLNRVYTQMEVDHKAVAIRRNLPGTGRITVRFVVNPDGQTGDIEIISAPVSHKARIQQAVSSWLYVPALKSGKRVRVRITASVKVDEG